MQLTGNRIFLIFITIAVVALISNILIDYFTPPDVGTDYTEIIDYVAIGSIMISVIFEMRKK